MTNANQNAYAIILQSLQQKPNDWVVSYNKKTGRVYNLFNPNVLNGTNIYVKSGVNHLSVSFSKNYLPSFFGYSLFGVFSLPRWKMYNTAMSVASDSIS